MHRYLLLALAILLPAAALAADSLAWYDRVQQLQEITVTSARRTSVDDAALRLIRRTIARYRELRIRNEELGIRNEMHSDLDSKAPHSSLLTPHSSLREAHSKTTLSANRLDLSDLGWLAALPDIYAQIELCPYNQQLVAPLVCVADGHAVGLTQLFRSGDFLSSTLTDFFPDVDIRRDHIRLLQHPFTSPISTAAPSVYRYFILDTIAGAARVRFAPRRLQQWAFSGELLIDTLTATVLSADLTIPRRADVNYVRRMRIVQQFTPQGSLVSDEMMVELGLRPLLPDLIVTRTTMHDGTFPPLTAGERRLAAFTEALRRAGTRSPAITLTKAVIENHLPLGDIIDLGPVRKLLGHNSYDGLRIRLGGHTTAKLFPRLFLDAYYARGWASHQHYYGAAATYSFRPKRYFAWEAPIRAVTFSSVRDVRYPGREDCGDIFSALRWAPQDNIIRFHRQSLTLQREETWGLTTTARLTAETALPTAHSPLLTEKHRTTLALTLRYAQGEKTSPTKNGRRRVSRDATVITLSHQAGLRHFLGGQGRSALTTLSLDSRQWLTSTIAADIRLGLAAQWNTVPADLLCFPESNQSYFARAGTFVLLRQMEMLADRQATLNITIDGGGKLLQAIPALRTLKLRERLGINILEGRMTTKNRATNTDLNPDKPYIELTAGIHNILKLFSIQYATRLTYGHDQGIRVGAELKF